MDQRRRIVINVVSNYITFVIFGISNFILLGYLVRKLGSDAFGVICLVVSLAAVTELIGTGICQASTKYISASISKKEDLVANELVSSSLLWFSICGLLGACFCGILSFYIDRMFDIPDRLVADSKLAMQLMAVRVLVCFPFNSFQGILLARQRYDLTNLAKSVTVVLRLIIVIVYFNLFSAGMAQYVIITIITLLIERLAWVAFSYRVSDNLRIKLALVTRKSLMVLIGFGGLILIIHIANIIGYEAVKWIIGLEMNVIDVGGYTLIAAIAVIVDQLVRSVPKVLLPVSSRYDALNLPEKNAQLGLIGTKYTMVIANCLCVLPLFMLKPFLYLWVGGEYGMEYLSHLAVLGMILLLGQLFISIPLCLLQMLTGVGKIRIPALVTMSWAVGGISIIWAYLHWVENSLAVVVIGITLARFVGSSVHLAYALKVFGISPVKFFTYSIVRPGVVGVIVFAISALLLLYMNVYIVSQFVVLSLILGLLYAGATWILVLSLDERRGVISKVSLITNKFC